MKWRKTQFWWSVKNWYQDDKKRWEIEAPFWRGDHWNVYANSLDGKVHSIEIARRLPTLAVAKQLAELIEDAQPEAWHENNPK